MNPESFNISRVADLLLRTAGLSDSSGSSNEYQADTLPQKTISELKLLGCPADPNTLKCILIVAEYGLNLHCISIDTLYCDYNRSTDTQPEFALVPILKDKDFVISGADAILAYIDKRGMAKSLNPTQSTKAGLQGYWIDIASCELDEKVAHMVKKSLLMSPPAPYSINKLLNEITVLLDMFEKQLRNNDYVIGEDYTLADIHWASDLYLLSLTPGKVLLNERKNVSRWFNKLQQRRSISRPKIVPFSQLPSARKIQRNELPGIHISMVD